MRWHEKARRRRLGAGSAGAFVGWFVFVGCAGGDLIFLIEPAAQVDQAAALAAEREWSNGAVERRFERRFFADRALHRRDLVRKTQLLLLAGLAAEDLDSDLAGFALSAAGRAAFREPFEPLMPEFSQVPFGDFASINAVLDESTAAVLLEPVQGEGGIVVAPPDYFSQVRAACDRVGALLIFDEIQTGLGRTGKLWASEHYGVVPDIMTTAKSLGGSLVPISATVFSEELREFLIPNPFIHLSTFGGSDLACAVALEVLNVIEDTGLVAHAAAMGDLLFAGLHEIAKDYPEFIADVRGLGLMVGVEYVEDSLGPRMSYHLSQHGVLAIYSGNQPAVMRLMPALVIEEPEVEFLLDAMSLALNDLRAGAGPDEATTRARRRPVRDAAKQ